MRAASVHRPPHLENLEVNVTAYERSMAAATRMHGSQRMSASVDQTPVTFRAGLSPYRATPLLVPREDMGTEHYGPTGQARRGQENTPRSATTTTTTTTITTTRVRHAQGTTSQSSVRSLLVLLLYKQRCLSCLDRPVCLGHYRPLQRRSASDKCSLRCRPMKQRDNIYRNF